MAETQQINEPNRGSRVVHNLVDREVDELKRLEVKRRDTGIERLENGELAVVVRTDQILIDMFRKYVTMAGGYYAFYSYNDYDNNLRNIEAYLALIGQDPDLVRIKLGEKTSEVFFTTQQLEALVHARLNLEGSHGLVEDLHPEEIGKEILKRRELMFSTPPEWQSVKISLANQFKEIFFNEGYSLDSQSNLVQVRLGLVNHEYQHILQDLQSSEWNDGLSLTDLEAQINQLLLSGAIKLNKEIDEIIRISDRLAIYREADAMIQESKYKIGGTETPNTHMILWRIANVVQALSVNDEHFIQLLCGDFSKFKAGDEHILATLGLLLSRFDFVERNLTKAEISQLKKDVIYSISEAISNPKLFLVQINNLEATIKVKIQTITNQVVQIAQPWISSSVSN